MGGDERPEIPQWGISAKNARPVAGPGWQALPGGACRALIPGKKVRSAMGSKPPSGIFSQAAHASRIMRRWAIICRAGSAPDYVKDRLDTAKPGDSAISAGAGACIRTARKPVIWPSRARATTRPSVVSSLTDPTVIPGKAIS